VAEGVDEARVEDAGEALALVAGEARRAAVGLRTGDVDLFVSDVQIAAEDDRLARLQIFEVREEGDVPLADPVAQARQTASGVWRVDRDKEEVVKLCGDDTPLVVVLGTAEAGLDVDGLDTAEQRGAVVARALGGVPGLVRVVGQVQLGVVLGRLDLLKTDDVRIHLAHRVHKTLLHRRTQPVDVP
jgi:hypothetical protein